MGREKMGDSVGDLENGFTVVAGGFRTQCHFCDGKLADWNCHIDLHDGRIRYHRFAISAQKVSETVHGSSDIDSPRWIF